MRVAPKWLWEALCALTAVAFSAAACGQEKPPRIPVFGVVRDAAGEPVAGATVRELRVALEGLDQLTATRLGLGSRPGASTTTNALGKFVLMVAAHGRFGIVATTDGTRSQVIAPAKPAGSHELRLHRVITTRGRVVDVEGGKQLPPYARKVRSIGPIESGVPGAYPLRPLAMIEEVTTNARGEFTLRTLAGAACKAADPWGHCAVALPTQEGSSVVLQREVRTVRGKLADDQTNKAVADYKLHLAGTTDLPKADGSFLVHVPKSHSLRITAPGYLPTGLPNDWDSPAGPDETLLVTRAPQVTLQFQDHRKQPVAGALVVSMEVAIADTGSSMLARRHFTDPKGRLVVSSPKTYGITFWIQQGNRLVRVLELAPCEADCVLAVPTATHAATGVIIDTNRLPAAHVPIYMSPVDTALGSRWPLAHAPLAFTDHAGKFTIPALANMPCRLASRSKTSLLAFTDEMQIENAGPIRMQLEKAPLVCGRVLDAKGNPARGIEVSARLLTIEEMPQRYLDFGIWASTTVSDASGQFTLPLVARDMSHFLGINPLQRLASAPTVVDSATDDVELVLK